MSFQIRASTEKLANGIQMGINYRLYAIERVNNSFDDFISFQLVSEIS